MSIELSRRQIVESWTNAEGRISVRSIEDKDIRENMALLLQNQKTLGVKAEALHEDISVGNYGSAGGAGAQFQPVALALVRRSFPELFAHKCVGVQPLTSPLGLAYALRYGYNSTPGTSFNGGSDAYEAAFRKLNTYSGYSGSTSGTSGTFNPFGANVSGTAFAQAITNGAGIATAAGEAWKIGNGTMPQLSLFFDKIAIEAKSRKLAATFSLESAQDLKSMQGVEIEKEMVSILNYETVAELDRELLGAMLSAALDTTKGGAAATVFDVATSSGRWSQEKFSDLVNVIIKKANDIATATFRGAGNFVIVSPRVATALQAAGPQFTANTADVNPTSTLAEVGKINGTITVYRDSYAGAMNGSSEIDYALVGYKGPGVSDCGIIYSPFITNLFNRAVRPDDFGINIGVMSRYAVTDSLLGSGRYYRAIAITNLASVLGN
jgi:hypothetical protein